ncbi:MAG TPA: hypothetical protein VIU82_03325 [Bosea sp. (in: a-proteobacteria)]
MERIELGASPNDGTGDPLRVAFGKINRNMEWLAAAVAARITALPLFAHLRHQHDEYVPRHLADGPPVEAPVRWGAMWIDTGSGRIYLATGTSSPADWRELRFAER